MTEVTEKVSADQALQDRGNERALHEYLVHGVLDSEFLKVESAANFVVLPPTEVAKGPNHSCIDGEIDVLLDGEWITMVIPRAYLEEAVI